MVPKHQIGLTKNDSKIGVYYKIDGYKIKVMVYAENIKENYEIAVSQYFDTLKLKCGQYGITYVYADINEGFSKILLQFMIKRQQFA